MTVWVVHPVKEDLSAAKQYGEIRYITGGYVHQDELVDGLLPLAMRERFLDMSLVFNRDTDYLLIVGDHLQIVQATVFLAVRFSGRTFKVLRYDREAKGYYPVSV